MTLADSPHGAATQRRHFGQAQDLTTIGVPHIVAIAMLGICTPILFSLAGIVLNPSRLMLLVVTVPLTVMLFTGRFGRVSAVDWLMMLYSGWLVVSVGMNNPSAVVQFAGSNVLEIFGGYLVGRAGIRNASDFQAFAKVLLIVIMVLFIPAIIETQTDRSMINEALRMMGFSTIQSIPAAPRMGLERAQAVFAHPIQLGVFSSSVFAMVFIGLRQSLSLTKRIMGAGMVVICTICSVSSGALLPLVLQMGLIGWAIISRTLPKRWLILAGLVIVLYSIVEIASDRPALVAILARITFNAHNVYMRSSIFEYGIQNVWANPLFGLGLRDWARPAWMHSSSVDNFWLLQAMRHGIPGFIFMVGACLVLLVQVGRRRFSQGSPLAMCQMAWMFAMISLTLTLCTVHIWGSLLTFALLLIASGHWLITAQEESAEDAQTAKTEPTTGNTYSRFPTKDAPAGTALARTASVAPQTTRQAATPTPIPARGGAGGGDGLKIDAETGSKDKPFYLGRHKKVTRP